MATLQRDPVMVIRPATVRASHSDDADWAEQLLAFIREAAEQDKTITVTAEERMYSPQQAADAVHVSRMTVQRRIDDGTIQAVKVGSHWRISESELHRWWNQVWSDTFAVMAEDIQVERAPEVIDLFGTVPHDADYDYKKLREQR